MGEEESQFSTELLGLLNSCGAGSLHLAIAALPLKEYLSTQLNIMKTLADFGNTLRDNLEIARW
ncbi:MAG: hypothetical protein Q4D38_03540 [Planctomycetia bacterium]|nr:hypothetical protein [Planctomycetia bacterium]